MGINKRDFFLCKETIQYETWRFDADLNAEKTDWYSQTIGFETLVGTANFFWGKRNFAFVIL